MKRFALAMAFVAMSLVVSSFSHAQEWAITYGGSSSEGAASIRQTTDGGAIVAGWTNSFGAGGNDLWVLKLGANGYVQWQKSYGRSGYDWTYSICETTDGGYVVAGSSWSSDQEKYDFWVLRLSSDGDIAWQKTYGGGDDDHPMSVQEVYDASGQPDGFVVAGYTASLGAGSYDVWVLRLYGDGGIAWQSTYGGSGYDTASSIHQILDGNGIPDGFIVAGITESFGVGQFDVWVLRLHPDGTIAWQKTYGGIDNEGADFVGQTFDGVGNPDGYIVAGGAWGGGQYTGHVLRLNNDGSVAWQKGFDAWSFDTRYFIQQTSDGGFMLAGDDDDVSQSDIWLSKLDANGGIVWQKIYGGVNQDSFGSLQQAGDGGYLVAGITTSFGTGSGDAFVLKIDATGQIPNCSAVQNSNTAFWDLTPTAENSGVVPVGTAVIPTNTAVVPGNTAGTTGNVCASTAADFTGSPVNGTIPLTVQFTDQSTASPTAWSWIFGDGGTSTQQNPLYTYNNAGDFTVTLMVTGPSGEDTEIKTDYIHAVEGQAHQEVWPDSTPGATPIQGAIDMAADGGVILVHDGTYWENIDFHGKGITVQSENGPEATIIDGSYFGTVVTFETGLDIENAVLQGFTIKNGDPYGIWCEDTYSGPTITDCIITNNVDRGMYCDEADATITGCTFTNNGGGLHCWASSPTITGCTFSDNSVDFYGGGVFLINGSVAQISNCVFNHNHGDLGGGICIHTDSNATISGCEFRNNTSKMGGGIDIALSDPTISNCTIVGNAAMADSSYSGEGGGILVRWASNPTIDNCHIATNSAEDGGGVYCENSNPTIANCTIRGNTANIHGGGFFCYDDYEAGNGPTVVNTILWEDMAGGIANEIYLGFGGAIDITYSDVEGGWPGTGVIDCDPDFVGGNDYHLLGSSCCIDAGTSSGAPGEDMDGEARPSGDGYDIGADEFYPVHAGLVVLDRQAYAPGVDVDILVTDSDLNTDPNQSEQYNNLVTITTNNDQTPYDTESTVIMTETGPGTGVFTGVITVAQAPAMPETGTVEIDCQPQETITATYHDLDDGTGSEAFPADMADTDCLSPAITNVQIIHFGYTVATITWDTDEAADSRLNYGTSQALGLTQNGTSLATSHTIHLTGLVPDTRYYFEVASMDEAGNLSTDSNGGQYYQVHTAVLETQWATTYGGSAHDNVYSVKQTLDQWGDPDGYVAAGNTHSFGYGHDDYWVVRVGLDGSIIWEKSYGTSTFEWAVSAGQTADGGYFVFGNSYYFNYDGRDFWMLKLNTDGSPAWQHIYGSSSGNDYAYAAQETFDAAGNSDGFVMAGFTASFGAGQGDVWVLKLNASGGIAWQKAYGGSALDGGYDVHQTADGGYVVAGNTESFAGTEGDIWVLKLNASGGIAWQKAYDYGAYERANTIRQSTDGGYIVAGETGMMTTANVLILKLDSDGGVTWSNTYSAPSQDDAKAIRETTDGNFVVSGWTIPSGGQGGQQFWLLKLKAQDGSVLWQKTYGGPGFDGANSIEQAVDGGLMVGGGSSYGAGSTDMWLLKLDENGELPGCNISKPADGVVAAAPITVANTNASVNDSSVTPISTTVSGLSTSAVSHDTCQVPTADFSADTTSGPGPLSVQFTDQSTGAIDTWAWVFGDGGNSTLQNPSHTYTSAGDYTVSLSVTGPGGTDTETKTDYISVDETTSCPVITEVKRKRPFPGMKIRIYGSGFGQCVPGSVVKIGKKEYPCDHNRVKEWTDSFIKFKLRNYACQWFHGRIRKRQRVQVIVPGCPDSNEMFIKVRRPDTCP